MKVNKGIIRKFGLLHYPDGERVSPRLPEAYQKSEGKQNCNTCLYYVNNKCKLFNAKVRGEYWCKKWKHGVFVNKEKQEYSSHKVGLMRKVRRRIKPDSIIQQRPVKNVRNERVRNRLVKNTANRLVPSNTLNSRKIEKSRPERSKNRSSIGSLKRSRKKRY